MEFKIDKKLRIGIISVLSLAIIGVGYLLYDTIFNIKHKEEKTPLYKYNNVGAINYTVFLKPNNLYPEDTLDEGKLYISEFVDHIKTDLKYEFNCNEGINVTGDYSITTKVQGFMGERDKDINIWEKDFPVIQNKPFSSEGGKLAVAEELDIFLDEYNNFATEIIEASKIKSQARLILLMDINFQGSTHKGDFEGSISPNLIIPLNSLMFDILGDSKIEKPGIIEDTIQVELPINKNSIVFYGAILGTLILLSVMLVFFIKTADIEDPSERELKRIFKRHGDRLVALSADIGNENEKMVRTIDDLVRIADEIDRPIFYKYSKDHKDIKKFYVIDENAAYVLDITELLFDKNMKQPEQIVEAGEPES